MTDLATTAQAIARHLPGWRFNQLNEYRHCEELTGEQGMKIHIATGREQGKLRIWLQWPARDRYGRGGHSWQCLRHINSSIGVSATRRPADIAADIKRRLLYHYATYYSLAMQERSEEMQKARLLRHQAQAICSVYQGAQIRDDREPDFSYQLQLDFPGSLNRDGFSIGRVQMSLNYGVSLELNWLPADTAIKVMALLQQERERQCKNPTQP